MANNQLADVTINVRIRSASDQLKYSINRIASGSGLVIPSVIWDVLWAADWGKSDAQPLSSNCSRMEREVTSEQNSAVLKSALGEPSPCANGAQRTE